MSNYKSTIRIIAALAAARAVEHTEAENNKAAAIEAKTLRWRVLLSALADYAEAFPGKVEVDFDEGDIKHGAITVHLAHPDRRLLLAERSNWGSRPCLLSRRNGYPIAAEDSPEGLLNALLEILAEHYHEAERVPAVVEEAA